MNLTDRDLEILAQCAIDAALQAGEALKKYRPKNLKVNRKKDAASLASAVVTEADLKSQEIIVSALRANMATYDLALLSEESPDDHSRFEKDYFWCIDPIDGTLPFTEGKDGYAVSISLVSKDGQSVIGVVYNPPSDRLWHAVLGQGAFRNGVEISLDRDNDDHGTIQYFVDRSFLDDPRFGETVRLLNTNDPISSRLTVSIDHIGGAVMQAIAALSYSHGCYFKFPKKANSGGSIWDYAATSCLYHELNLHSTDIYGNGMDLNRAESTFMNHNGILFSTNEDVYNRIVALYRSISSQGV